MQDFHCPVHVMKKVVIKNPKQMVGSGRTEFPGIAEGKDEANLYSKQIFMRGMDFFSFWLC